RDRHRRTRRSLRRHRVLPLVRRAQPRLPAPKRPDRARLADVHLLLPPARPPLPLLDPSQHSTLAQRDHPRLGTRRVGASPPPEMGRAAAPRRRGPIGRQRAAESDPNSTTCAPAPSLSPFACRLVGALSREWSSAPRGHGLDLPHHDRHPLLALRAAAALDAFGMSVPSNRCGLRVWIARSYS